MRLLLCRWLDFVGYGIIFSTALCLGLYLFDVGGFWSATTLVDGGGYVRVTVWVLLIVLLAPVTAMTDSLFR
ncbi:MAG: hypothetical protein AAGK57_05780 [Pseudomonadota bacterium]